MNKIFDFLAKPARLAFIICAFVFAFWFAVRTALSIDGQFMNVLTNIITLFIGTGLCCLPPLFLLLKKEELAKIFFVLLLGYWVLTAPSQYFFLAETFAVAREFYPVFVSIFLLLTGLALVGILVLVILQMILGLKFLRPIVNLIALIFVGASFLTAILFIIEAAIMGAGWTMYVEYGLMDFIVLPVTVGFGCLYFFQPQKSE